MERTTVSVYVIGETGPLDERMTFDELVELLKNLRDMSFIKVRNRYLNKMQIKALIVANEEMFNRAYAKLLGR